MTSCEIRAPGKMQPLFHEKQKKNTVQASAQRRANCDGNGSAPIIEINPKQCRCATLEDWSNKLSYYGIIDFYKNLQRKCIFINKNRQMIMTQCLD